MAINMSLVFCLFVLPLLLAVNGNSNKKCPITRREAESCSRSVYVVGDRNQFLPKNEADLDIFCRKVSTASDCLGRYARCLQGFKRRLLQVVVRFARSEHKTFCSPEERKFIRYYLTCSWSRKEQEYQCMDKYIAMIKYIRDHVSAQDQIPAYCCAFQTFRECVVEVTLSNCPSMGTAAAQAMDQFLVSTQNTFANIGCTRREKSVALCLKTSPNVTDSLYMIANKTTPEPQSESPLFLFMDIVSNMTRN